MEVIVLGTKTLIRLGISLNAYEAIVDKVDDITMSFADKHKLLDFDAQTIGVGAELGAAIVGGTTVGPGLGSEVGIYDGRALGKLDDSTVGCEGPIEGSEDGIRLLANDGEAVGTEVETTVGCEVKGDAVGIGLIQRPQL